MIAPNKTSLLLLLLLLLLLNLMFLTRYRQTLSAVGATQLASVTSLAYEHEVIGVDEGQFVSYNNRGGQLF